MWNSKPLLEETEEGWDRVMAVNAKGVFLGCKRAVQQMMTQEPRDGVRGRIVNISSQMGMICAPGEIAYGTGKAAAAYLTRQIAVDYAKQGIICNAVAPGKINTSFATTGARLDFVRARTPLPRLGEPEDIARAVLFLASDEATYITGENLMVDGGWMAG
jgi:NAD(P)-dependent dehydrogenase (short-subunit alcohol dehydrogenase family)